MVPRWLGPLLCAAGAWALLPGAKATATPTTTATAASTPAPMATSGESEAQRNQRLAACIRHLGGLTNPEYPAALRRMGAEGRVVARLRFTAADLPPEFELLHRPSVGELQFLVEDFVRGLRMPCHEGAAFRLQQTYVFVLAGNSFGFRPGLSFADLLSIARTRTGPAAVLDTTTMACPFPIKFFYLQPLRRNGVWVDEVGPTSPSRRPLIEALAESELTLTGARLSEVYGDTARIEVPCGRFELPSRDG